MYIYGEREGRGTGNGAQQYNYRKSRKPLVAVAILIKNGFSNIAITRTIQVGFQ